MQADRQYPRIVVEGVLHAIAMMRVDVQIDDVVQAELQPCQQPQNGVVEEAEARRPVRPSMVGAAAGAVDDPAGRGQARRQHHTAGRNCRTAIDVAIHRVALGADAEAGARSVADSLIRFRLAQSGDIGGIMETRQLASVAIGASR